MHHPDHQTRHSYIKQLLSFSQQGYEGYGMVSLIAAVMLSSLPFAQLSFADAKSDQAAARQFASNTDGTSGDLPSLPPAPRGKSTVIGGSIRDVDPVLDRLTL